MKRTVIAVLLVLTLGVLVGCSPAKPSSQSDKASQTDKSSTGGKTETDTAKLAADGAAAFEGILKANSKNVKFHKELNHWGIVSSLGDALEWTNDMKAGKNDLSISINADPLIKAGLDVKKMAGPWAYKASMQDSSMKMPPVLELILDLGDTSSNSANSAADTFRAILTNNKNLVDFHQDTNLYSMMLGKGYSIEWAKAGGNSHGDIVIAIPAEPLIKAGLDKAKLPKEYMFQAAKQDPKMGQLPDLLMYTPNFK